MQLRDFNYTFPQELIAHYPADKRDSSRMMVLDRTGRTIDHRSFVHFSDYFKRGDVLVLNDSKVFLGRLFGKKKTGGNIEVLLLREIESNVWECMANNSRRLGKGVELIFSNELSGTILDEDGDIRRIQLTFKGSFSDIIENIGHVPLPPYIKRADEPLVDRDRYQTVYAEKTGSAAAPTAGFHFTSEILDSLKKRGVRIVYVTLHVGAGTFLPIRTENICDHSMHGEFYTVPEETAKVINQAKEEGRSITAVGTTAVRTLESACDKSGRIESGPGYTEKFIYPTYRFCVVDRLLTNFHQPKSTLLVLVSAFAERDLIFKAYEEAIEKRYRLFSYGDCMIIL